MERGTIREYFKVLEEKDGIKRQTVEEPIKAMSSNEEGEEYEVLNNKRKKKETAVTDDKGKGKWIQKRSRIR